MKVCRYCSTPNWSFQLYCEKCAGALVRTTRSTAPQERTKSTRYVFGPMQYNNSSSSEMGLYLVGSTDTR